MKKSSHFRSPTLLIRVTSIAAVACLLSHDVTMLGQNPPGLLAPPAPGSATVAPSGPVVRQIVIQYAGPETVSRERILANMRTAVGRPYSEQAVEEDIRSLYATGNITNVRIFGEPTRDNGVKVVVVVQSKASVGDVTVEGATQISAAKLRKQLSIKPGQTLNEAALEADRQKILDAYSSRGFSDTAVKYRTDVNQAAGTTSVTFSVTEGGKTTIRAVRFEGNEAFSEKQLRKVVKTKPANLLSFVTKAGRLNNEQLDQDVNTLREYYQNHGYADAVVEGPRIDRAGDGKVTLTFAVREGRQYRVGPVQVAGAQVFSPDEIRGRLVTKEGDVFSPKNLRDDTKTIGNLYGARGYVDLRATAETASAGSGAISVTYRIEEGSQSYVERINVSGNTRTKDKVIRRELTVAPGDVFDTTRVDLSKQRLQNLNYFSQVQTFPTDTLVPGRKDLNVVVEEKRTGSFNFGAGFSSIDSLLGFAEVQQSNFDITRWPDFTGGGQRFRTRVQYGTKRKDFLLSLTEPYFLDYQLAVGGEVFYNESNFVSSVYNQKNYGFDINVRKELATYRSGRLDGRIDYRLEDIDLFGLNSGVSQTIRRDAGNHTKSSVTAGLTYDSRDSVFLTRRGQRVDLSAYIAGGFLGGNENIYGFDLTGSQYFLLPRDTILLINGEIASVSSFSGSDHVPIYDRLYLGGPNNLRGFRFRHVSPKDENNESIGGNSLARLTLELTTPVIERVRAAAFVDTGFVNAGSYSFDTGNLATDVGLGLRLDLPIGPVRLDYGVPVSSPKEFGHGGKFNFSIGYQF